MSTETPASHYGRAEMDWSLRLARDLVRNAVIATRRDLHTSMAYMVNFMPVISFLYSGLEICLKLFWGSTDAEWRTTSHRLHKSFDKAASERPALRPLFQEVVRDFRPLGWSDPSGLLHYGVPVEIFLRRLSKRWESIRYWGMDEGRRDQILNAPIDPYLLLDLWKAAHIVLFETGDPIRIWRDCELALRGCGGGGLSPSYSVKHSDNPDLMRAINDYFQKHDKYLQNGGSDLLDEVLTARKTYVDLVAKLEPETAALDPGSFAFDIHAYRKEMR